MANLPSRRPSLLLQKCIAAVALALTGFVWPIFFADEAMNYLTAEYSYQPRGLIGIAVWLGPLTAFVLVWALWYQRWIRTNQSQLVRQQLAKIAGAQRALKNAAEFLDEFTAALKHRGDQVDQLQTELASLQTLNKDTIGELREKLTAVDIVNRRRIWFERFFAFAIGVLSSLAATWLWEHVWR
jgi:hypothetical protein